MRPSEKFEAKAAGQKCSEAWFRHVENVFGRQRRHRTLQPDEIELVIWIGSKCGKIIKDFFQDFVRMSLKETSCLKECIISLRLCFWVPPDVITSYLLDLPANLP